MFTDIHTHILHSIDDGPENFEQTKELLSSAIQNGVNKLVATPHFYAERHSLSERLETAKVRYRELLEFVSQNNLPISVSSGFEVRYFKGISKIEALNDVCINNSAFLLLELEPLPITEEMIDELLDMHYSGYNIILAHIERYTKLSGFKRIKPLIANGVVLAQCNASSFISGAFQRPAFRLLKEGLVSVIASDTHSLEYRPPNLKEAYDIIEKKFGSRVKNQLIFEAEKIFDNC